MIPLTSILPQTLIVLLILTLATPATAHGYLASITIAGQTYQGNVPSSSPGSISSIIRQVSDIGPVQPTDNPFLNCGLNSMFAQEVASIMPGDEMEFKWVGGGGNNWPHNTGPMLTYLTPCTTSCTSFNSSSSLWFKIQQIGRATPTGPWAQAALTTGGVATVTLPSNLAPGDYLIRHELIALQNAVAEGGAEFYPVCVQVSVGGSGSGKPKEGEEVEFPGGYHDNDPGIYDSDVYDPSANYTFPGPPIASFVGDSSDDSGSSGTNSSSSSSSSGSSSNSASTSGSGSDSGSSSGSGDMGICRLQRRVSVSSVSVSDVSDVSLSDNNSGDEGGSEIGKRTRRRRGHGHGHVGVGMREVWTRLIGFVRGRSKGRQWGF